MEEHYLFIDSSLTRTAWKTSYITDVDGPRGGRGFAGKQVEVLAESIGDKEIPESPGVGGGTVHGYVTSMLHKKLGVNSSRLQALLLFAVRHGFVCG